MDCFRRAIESIKEQRPFSATNIRYIADHKRHRIGSGSVCGCAFVSGAHVLPNAKEQGKRVYQSTNLGTSISLFPFPLVAVEY